MGNFEQPDESDSPEKALQVPTDDRYGVTEVYSPPNKAKAAMDIVLVHGLGGSSHGTWTTRPPTVKSQIFWPKDLLPDDIPNVRVLTFGYDSTPGRLFGPTSTNMVHQHATKLMTDLHYFRAATDSLTRPIVFVCHSLGGIVVKKALITSNSYTISHNDDLRSIRVSTYGIVFMGTPHMGADLAKWGSLIGSIARTVTLRAWVDSNPALVGALEKNSEILQNVTEEFVSISGELEMFFFYEELPMRLPGNLKQEMIVDYSSAVPQAVPNIQKASIHANHSDMCKFESRNSDGWTVLIGVLKKFATKGPDHIARKWDEEYDRKALATKIGIQDAIAKIGHSTPGRSNSPSGRILDDITPPVPSTPKIISGGTAMMEIEEIGDDLTTQLVPLQHPRMFKPSTLAENAYFVGREKDLSLIHGLMMQKRAVAITAGTGLGKTHLARQYFFSHRDRYRAGVFWLDCKSLGGAGAGVFSTDVLDQQFTEIAERLLLPPTIEFNDEPYVITSDVIRRRVIHWFEQNQDWLLVLDGVDVLEDEQISLVARYVPLVANCGSIILTTVNHSLAGAARLGSPQLLRLGPLDAEEAMNMLFHYAQISSPTSIDTEAASELLRELEYIPLMIHSAGSYIKSKSMPVSSYLREYKKRPFVDQGQVDVEPFHAIFENIEQRYEQARNLIRILCFFNQQTPVDMLLWGIKALPRHTQRLFITYEGGRPDFNATIGHLLAHSLIERTSKIDEDASLAGDSMAIDTVRLHSVAQSVAISRMRKESKKVLQSYLESAIEIFCSSFATVDSRRHEGEFFISDYKRYVVHGHRLQYFSNKYKQPSQLLDGVVKKVEELAKGDSNIVRRSMFRNNSITDSSSFETPTPSSPRGVDSWPWQFEDSMRANSPERQEFGAFDTRYQDVDELDRPASPFDERKDRLKRETLKKFIDNVNRMREEKPFRFRYEPPSAAGGPHNHHPPLRPPFRAFTAVEPRHPRTPATAQVVPESVLSTPVESPGGWPGFKETLKGYLSRPASTTDSTADSMAGKESDAPPPSPPILTNIFHPRSPGPHYNPLLPSMTPVTASSFNNPHICRGQPNRGDTDPRFDSDHGVPISLPRGRSGSLPNMMLPAYTPMPPYPLSPSTEPLTNPFDTEALVSLTPNSHTRPFTPGYIPTRDITHSPIVRSIGIPQPPRPAIGINPYTFPASDPILEVIPPRALPGRGRKSSRSPSTTGSRTVGRRTRTPSPFTIPRGRPGSAGNNSFPGPPGLGIGGVRYEFDDSASTPKRHMSLGSAIPTTNITAGLAPPGKSVLPTALLGAGSSPLRRSSVPGIEAQGGEAMMRSTSAPGQSGGSGVSREMERSASVSPSRGVRDGETQTPPTVQRGFGAGNRETDGSNVEEDLEEGEVFHDAQTPKEGPLERSEH